MPSAWGGGLLIQLCAVVCAGITGLKPVFVAESTQQHFPALKAGKSLSCRTVYCSVFLLIWNALRYLHFLPSVAYSEVCLWSHLHLDSHDFILVGWVVWGVSFCDRVFSWCCRGQYRVIYMTPEFCSGNLDLLQDLDQTIGKLGVRLRMRGQAFISWLTFLMVWQLYACFSPLVSLEANVLAAKRQCQKIHYSILTCQIFSKYSNKILFWNTIASW